MVRTSLEKKERFDIRSVVPDDYRYGMCNFSRFEFEYYAPEFLPYVILCVNEILVSSGSGFVVSDKFDADREFVFYMKKNISGSKRYIEFDYENYYKDNGKANIDVYLNDYLAVAEQEAYAKLIRDVLLMVLNIRDITRYDVKDIDRMLRVFPQIIDANLFETEINKLVENFEEQNTDALHNCEDNIARILFANQDSEVFEYLQRMSAMRFLFFEYIKHGDLRYANKSQAVVEDIEVFVVCETDRCIGRISESEKNIYELFKKKMREQDIPLKKKSLFDSAIFGMFDIPVYGTNHKCNDLIEYVNYKWRVDVFSYNTNALNIYSNCMWPTILKRN